MANELANFNKVVEKWDSSKIGGKTQGRLQGEAGRGQGLHDSKGGHIQHTGCRSRRGELNPGSDHCGHAGCRSSGSSPDTDGGYRLTRHLPLQKPTTSHTSTQTSIQSKLLVTSHALIYHTRSFPSLIVPNHPANYIHV
jgi:hypothetical protein